MEITQALVQELLHYDPETGIFTWKPRGQEWFSSEREMKRWNTRYANKRAGCQQFMNDYPYRAIRVLGKATSEHRLAFLYMTGKFPDVDTDHRNRDATDNRWANLRSLTRGQNCRNRSRRMDNQSGVTGVSWSEGVGKWRARVTHERSVYHLGYFTELDEAAMEVLEFRADHGFTREHGLELAHYHKEAI